MNLQRFSHLGKFVYLQNRTKPHYGEQQEGGSLTASGQEPTFGGGVWRWQQRQGESQGVLNRSYIGWTLNIFARSQMSKRQEEFLSAGVQGPAFSFLWEGI